MTHGAQQAIPMHRNNAHAYVNLVDVYVAVSTILHYGHTRDLMMSKLMGLISSMLWGSDNDYYI